MRHLTEQREGRGWRPLSFLSAYFGLTGGRSVDQINVITKSDFGDGVEPCLDENTSYLWRRKSQSSDSERVF